ncbi:MAG: hypothetical protein KGH71_05515 [Candidatus Micrarchaeota archaeon]|nr:hypothetical protein [Candidatus Micrarchaeota archaeon]
MGLVVNTTSSKKFKRSKDYPLLRITSVFGNDIKRIREALSPEFKGSAISFQAHEIVDYLISDYLSLGLYNAALDFAVDNTDRETVFKIAKSGIEYYQSKDQSKLALETAQFAVKFFQKKKSYYNSVYFAGMVDVSWAEKIGKNVILKYEKRGLKSQSENISKLLRDIALT